MENRKNIKAEHVLDGHQCCAPGVRPQQSQSWLGRILVAIGIGGAAVAALCCTAPFLLAGVLTAIGLGFILKEAILMGFLVLSLAVVALGYYFIQRAKHA
jgi:mercuric ion transport protein